MNVYQITTASGQKTYKIDSNDPKKSSQDPKSEESEKMTTDEKITTGIILAIFVAFVVFIFPNVVVLLVFVLFSGGAILITLSLAEILNPETKIGGKTYYPWSEGSPADLGQMIKADKIARFVNNRVCSVCGGKLGATQTTCQCGHIVNCIICYQPIYEHAIVFDCCFSSIHRSHLTSITASCPYCKTSLPRFVEANNNQITSSIKQTYTFQDQSTRW